MRIKRLGCWIVIVPFVLVAIYIAIANAQEHHPQDIHERFYSTWMHPDNPQNSCCHNQDCSPAASRFVNNRWEAQRDGIWIPIPPSKIETKRDSPDGRSHLCGRWEDDKFYPWCFVRGYGS